LTWIPRGPFSESPSSRRELVERATRLLALVGNTPLRCWRLGGAELCVKLEYSNPTGSHKDRIAVYMIRGLAEEGLLEPGGCVAEISSGNTAAAVAWASRLLGLKARLYVEGKISPLKIGLIRYFGGEVVEIERGPEARARAVEDMGAHGCVYLDQSGNEYNWRAHYETTGREILEQTCYDVDAFVMGAGTGGTVTGVGERLKESLGNTLVAAVTPRGSRLAGGPGADVIEGLASTNIPRLLEARKRVLDRVIEVSSAEAIEGVKTLLKLTGVAAGPSTGAALVGAVNLLEEGLLDGRPRIVIVAADHLSRYPSLLG
jgi:cysteine synthase A